MAPSTYNQPVPGIPYFIPSHAVSPGTPTNSPINANKKIPTLFTPLRIRGTTLRNRTIVAPMCQYSTAESGPAIGALTPYHISTLGHYALKGAALVFIEATGVQPNGRISPNCPGLWSDDQIPGVKAVADFIHAQNSLVGMQLAHAGRKASTVSPWVASRFKKPSVRADAEATGRAADRLMHDLKEHGGWDALRQDMRLRKAVDHLIESATAIPMAQAEARERLWTPEDERRKAAAAAPSETSEGKPAPAGKLWTPGDPR